MIRMFDFECPTHGLFEVMITTETVPEFFECRCGQMVPRVWRRFRGMQPQDGVHAISFGGRTFRRDDVEEVLANKNETAPMSEEKRAELHDRFSRASYREMHGYRDSPAEEAPPLDDIATNALKNVHIDAQLAEAHTNKLADVMRTTDFKE